ncbi:MAG: hypothetical protein QOG67_328 [Verrucomicrobiota bacterium]|jgi:hypothetical protein
MTKAHILEQIRRTTAANGDTPPGRARFFKETGIGEPDWLGKYWVRWSDAIREAGYEPNKMRGAYTEAFLLDKLVALVQELGHFPVRAEYQMKTRSDATFPNHKTFQRIGSKAQLVAKLIAHCRSRGGLESIIAICDLSSTSDRLAPDQDTRDKTEYGFVYLLKSGRFYKIGRSNAAGRRERELAIQLPEKATNIHVIRTDDPTGIEAYWHNRFAAKRRRKDAEWFDLDASDIRAFRRRTFM